MSFTELHLDSNIQKAITACGYDQPTPVQAQSIPAILAGKDVVACAQTGTGKTAAFVLPALHLLSTQKHSRKTKILILTPTRELANQITKAAAQYGKFLKFNIVSLVGGMSYNVQIRDLQRGADIIVATPGRLLDHIESQRVNLSDVEMLVLDEADRMLDMGFTDDVNAIANMTPAKRQTLLFSATVDKQLDQAIRQMMRDPIRIDLSNQKLSAPKIAQKAYRAKDLHHKTRMLRQLLNEENMFKAIIFSATKMHADKLATQLRHEGFSAAALHGDLKQNVRNRTIDQLRQGKIQYLIATDVAARGIDISDITHVINYDMPRFCEDYVHRIGRTGRAGKSGVAISFVSPADFKHLQRIERYIGQRLEVISGIDGVRESAESRSRPLIPEVKEERPRRGSFKPRDKSSTNNRSFKKYDREDSGDRANFGRRRDADERPSFGRRRDDSDDRPAFGKRRGSDASEERRPAFGKRRDSASGDRPAFGKRRSGASEDKPAFGKRRGDASEDRPAFGKRRSSASEDRPAFGKRRSSASEDRPAFGKRRGSASEDRPAFGKRRGSASEDRPAFGKRRGSSSEDRPVFGKQRRGDASEDRPAFAKRRGASEDRPTTVKRRDDSDAKVSYGKSRGGKQERGGFKKRKAS